MDAEEREFGEIKIVGRVVHVQCAKCYTVQDFASIKAWGHCRKEQLTRGWEKCFSTEFLEISHDIPKDN